MSTQNGCLNKIREIRKEDVLLYIESRYRERKNPRSLSPLNVICDIPAGIDIFFAAVTRGICRWGVLVEEAIPGVDYNRDVLGLVSKGRERGSEEAGPHR